MISTLNIQLAIRLRLKFWIRYESVHAWEVRVVCLERASVELGVGEGEGGDGALAAAAAAALQLVGRARRQLLRREFQQVAAVDGQVRLDLFDCKVRIRLVNFESLPDQRFTGKTIGKIILPVKTGKLQFFKIRAKNYWKLCQAPFWSIWEINVHPKTPHFILWNKKKLNMSWMNCSTSSFKPAFSAPFY